MRYWNNGRNGVTRGLLACTAVLVLTQPVVVLAQGDMPGYGGPAVASRGINRAGARGSESVTLTPSVSVVGTFDRGLTGVGLDKTGNIISSGDLYGVEANVGLYGTKRWRHRRLGLDYTGNYRHYSSASYYNGSDHAISIDFVQQFGRKGAFVVRGTGGSSSRALGGGISLGGLSDSSYLVNPGTEIFDNRIYFADFTASYIRQLTPRSSFSAGGGVITMRRHSSVLVGANGIRGQADYVRRFSRSLSVGGSFTFYKLEFPRVFGDSTIMTYSGQVSRSIGRSWMLSGSLGLMRLELTGTRSVVLDPVVAELLGQRIGREAFHSVNYMPSGSFNATHKMRKSDFSLGYNRGPSVGNGIVLTSRSESISAGYTRVISQRLYLGASTFYSNLSGTGAFAGSFKMYSLNTDLNYRLNDYAGLTFAFQERKMISGQDVFSRWGTRMSGGFSFHPRGFSLWPK